MDYGKLASKLGGTEGAGTPNMDYAALAAKVGGNQVSAQEQSITDKLLHQAGLTGRHLIEGAADTVGLVSDPIAALINAGGANASSAHDVGQYVADKLGLPQPQNPTERVVGDASRMLVGTGGIIKGANVAGKSLSPIAQKVAQSIGARPDYQAASAIGGGYAGGTAREEGGSPATQLASSLIGSVGLPVATSTIENGIKGVSNSYDAIKRFLTNTQAPLKAPVTPSTPLQMAQAEGYTVPPSMANPSISNRLLEGFAGKLTTGQAASMKNQSITNNLVKADLGIPESLPINKDTLKAIRSDAGEAYNAIKGTGTVTADKAYQAELDNIAKKYQGAGKDFPDLAKNEAVDIVNSIKVNQFDADSAIDAISVLRSNADDAFAKGNKGTGKAYKDAANAIEDLLGRHLEATGAPADIINNFRNARATIAKTYSVENALNPTTGNIIASKLTKQLDKGRPLSEGMKKAAQFAGAFPTAAKEVSSSMPGLSPLDYATGGLAAAATQNPALLAATVARPAVRSVILSKPYQNMMTTPSAGGEQTLPLSALLGIGSLTSTE